MSFLCLWFTCPFHLLQSNVQTQPPSTLWYNNSRTRSWSCLPVPHLHTAEASGLQRWKLRHAGFSWQNHGFAFAMLCISYNVSLRLVWWYPIVASFFQIIQCPDVWGGASIVASFFPVFVFQFFVVLTVFFSIFHFFVFFHLFFIFPFLN